MQQHALELVRNICKHYRFVCYRSAAPSCEDSSGFTVLLHAPSTCDLQDSKEAEGVIFAAHTD